MNAVLARSSVSISDLKRNPTQVITQAHGEPVVVLNHNKPTAYLVPAATYEVMMEALDDLDLARIVTERLGEASVTVSLDDL